MCIRDSHSHQPVAEAVYEESRVGGFDPLCQLGDIIGFAVPGRERKEIVGEGLENVLPFPGTEATLI